MKANVLLAFMFISRKQTERALLKQRSWSLIISSQKSARFLLRPKCRNSSQALVFSQLQCLTYHTTTTHNFGIWWVVLLVSFSENLPTFIHSICSTELGPPKSVVRFLLFFKGRQKTWDSSHLVDWQKYDHPVWVSFFSSAPTENTEVVISCLSTPFVFCYLQRVFRRNARILGYYR